MYSTVADYYLRERHKATQATQPQLSVEEQIKKVESSYKSPKVPWVRCCLECGDPLIQEHVQCIKCGNSFCSKHIRLNACHKCRILVSHGRDPNMSQAAVELVTKEWYIKVKYYQSELNIELAEYERLAGSGMNMGFKIFSEEDRTLYNKIIRAEHRIRNIMYSINSLTTNMPSSIAHLVFRTNFTTTLTKSINEVATKYSTIASKMTIFRVKYYNQVSWALEQVHEQLGDNSIHSDIQPDIKKILELIDAESEALCTAQSLSFKQIRSKIIIQYDIRLSPYTRTAYEHIANLLKVIIGILEQLKLSTEVTGHMWGLRKKIIGILEGSK